MDDLRIVYRILRKISDWALDGYYSDVHVQVDDANAMKHGPMIIAATHHNEIIDIATLAATIPYRRPLSFWAKSTMFRNPISRGVLLSSGSIPVERNLNPSSSSSSASSASVSKSQTSLFASTTAALAYGDEGGVVGVFPEGTSYTLPGIVRGGVRSGAGWSAVSFWNSRGEGEGRDVSIVPVGIVYTDKARYRTRVYVHYTKPILLSEFKAEYNRTATTTPDEKETDAALVKRLTQEIERRLREAVVDAPDWNTLYAARLARNIIWGDDDNVPLREWVRVTQRLIDQFTSSSDGSVVKNKEAKDALIKYHALLYHSGLTHTSLQSISPLPTPLPPPLRTLRTLFESLLPLLTPTTLLIIPPLLTTHLPAHLCASLATRFLAPKWEEEEEGQAQWRVVVGGFGRGVLGFAAVWRVVGWVGSGLAAEVGGVGGVGRGGGVVGKALGVFVVMWVLQRWFGVLVDRNLKRYNNVRTALTRFLGSLSRGLSDGEAKVYESPPRVKVGRLVRRSVPEDNDVAGEEVVRKVAGRKLVGRVLEARVEAVRALEVYLGGKSD